MPSLAGLLVIACLLAANAILVAYEMALSAVSHARLVALAKAGTRGAAAALQMKINIERSLAAAQLGITLFSAIAAACSGASVREQLEPRLVGALHLSPSVAGALAIAIAVIPLAVLTIIFAELAPKVLALRHKERVVCVLSPAMQAFTRIAAPVVGLLEKAVRVLLALLTRLRGKRGAQVQDATSLHELTAAAALARTAKLIGAREERIVISAAQLSSRLLREITLPAADISVLPTTATLESALVRAHLDMHTRFPVARVDHDPQTIEGYVTFKDLVTMLRMSDGTPALHAITRPIRRIPGTHTIAQALDEMVRGRTHIALVTDERDHVAGMVTLEDIIEELVGDIEDEFDRLPAHLQQTGDGLIVGGGVPIDTLLRQLGLPTLELRTDTSNRPMSLADWLQSQLGRAPAGGETIVRAGLQVLVRKLRRKRLAEAFVRRAVR